MFLVPQDIRIVSLWTILFEIAKFLQSVGSSDLLAVIDIASAFYECFDAENFGAARTSDSKQTQTRKQKTDQIEKSDLLVEKVGSLH